MACVVCLVVFRTIADGSPQSPGTVLVNCLSVPTFRIASLLGQASAPHCHVPTYADHRARFFAWPVCRVKSRAEKLRDVSCGRHVLVLILLLCADALGRHKEWGQSNHPRFVVALLGVVTRELDSVPPLRDAPSGSHRKLSSLSFLPESVGFLDWLSLDRPFALAILGPFS